MTRPLRVEVVVPVGGMGGAESMVLSFLDHQAERLEVDVLALGETPFLDAARERGWPVAVLPTGKRPVDIAVGALRLARRWRRSSADVALANGVKPAAVAVPAGMLTGLPVVWMKHDFSYDRLLARPLAARAAAVMASSPAVARATGRSDVVVVTPPRPEEPPVDVDRLVPGTDRVVACVGRLLPYKGVDDVVRALALRAAAAWHLAVVGADDPADPGERARLEALAKTCGVDDRVHFLGQLPGAGRLLGGVDVVAVPTKVNEQGVGREGWSMVADEAMAAGVPVLATRGGGLGERLGDAGVLVDQAAPEQVAAALARLADPDVRRAMGAAGRALVAALPRLETGAAVFASVLASAARRPGAGLKSDRPVSVVVPFYNEGDGVQNTVDAVAVHLGPGDELVAVDDGSVDDTGEALEAVAARLPAARVVRLPANRGPAAARNAGVRAARADVVACTDAGCVPQPGWLDALRAAFDEARPPDLLTGVYEVEARSAVEQAAALACYPRVDEARRPSLFVRLYAAAFGRAFDPRFSNGRSMAFTRAAWERAGGFPEHLRTGEDVAFGTAVGERCELSVDAGVAWQQRPTLAATARMYLRYGEGDGQARQPTMVGRDLTRVVAYPAAVGLVLRGGPAGRALVGLGAAAYLSLPVARAARSHAPAGVYPLLPVALAVKDVAKGVGCLRGLLVHSRP
jgi:glycosyltransferase involved in cell wall biosynthesis